VTIRAYDFEAAIVNVRHRVDLTRRYDFFSRPIAHVLEMNLHRVEGDEPLVVGTGGPLMGGSD
jgi:hypothetical protein